MEHEISQEEAYRNECDAWWRERQRLEKRAEAVANWVMGALLVLALAALAFVVWNAKTSPVKERAAYLEGRWDLDHATAMAFAKAEFAAADVAGKEVR